MSATTITKTTVPNAISKAALQEILDRKKVPYTTKMNKTQLWELTQQSQPKAEVGKAFGGEY